MTTSPFDPVASEAPAAADALSNAPPPRIPSGPTESAPNLTAQVAVIPQMLSSLDSLSPAGKQYVMGKIVTFLRDWLVRGRHTVGHRNQHALGDLIRQLDRQAGSPWPDTDVFRSRADSFLRLLVAVAKGPAVGSASGAEDVGDPK